MCYIRNKAPSGTGSLGTAEIVEPSDAVSIKPKAARTDNIMRDFRMMFFVLVINQNNIF